MIAPAASFNLLTEPWIPVIGTDAQRREVGLNELLLDARGIRRIVGDTPPMTAALYRLALALLHRAYGPVDEDAWGHLWSAKQLPSAKLRDYAAGQSDRFDLFHPERPFLQSPALARITPSTVAKLVPHLAVGNNVTLFDHTTAGDRTVLSPAQAARWLVTAQAFDPGGMKTPFEKVKSSERAPCNLLGVVLVEGGDLKETLLLNALTYAPDLQTPYMTSSRDMPAWEEPDPPEGAPGERRARGWTDLLTWPSRRILLVPTVSGDTVVVDGVVLTPGVRFKGDLPEEEKMAAFRRPLGPNGKPKKDAPLLPIRLNPLRGVWRHSVELLMIDLRQEGRTRIRPRALEQIAALAGDGHIPRDAVYTLRVLGQQLDKNASVVEAYLEEQVPAPVPLLRARDTSLGALIGSAIALADNAGAALRHMERDYNKDKRADPTSTLDVAYWPQLPRRFATFLREVARAHDADEPESDAVEQWTREVYRIAKQAAERWAERAPADTRDVFLMGKHLRAFHTRLNVLVDNFRREARSYTTKGRIA
ncbi:type I-E CRISPR-associated protein Cse1/CasA [Saccharothrix hoggarensis]|uniref:Type I-E CRISPR-associated protein Cse1/CasA n=1 Tax=Saccharothrix hoggarensis TaxID=913853 RepID=A0ABW3QMP2_9PSEU